MPRVIKVYSPPDCLQYREVKEFLEEHDLVYQDLNVALDFTAMKEWMEKSRQMDVPMVEIDGDVFVGYDESRLKERLRL
jgi:glutaredoxin 3